jgi:hypothetical protein
MNKTLVLRRAIGLNKSISLVALNPTVPVASGLLLNPMATTLNRHRYTARKTRRELAGKRESCEPRASLLCYDYGLRPPIYPQWL